MAMDRATLLDALRAVSDNLPARLRNQQRVPAGRPGEWSTADVIAHVAYDEVRLAQHRAQAMASAPPEQADQTMNALPLAEQRQRIVDRARVQPLAMVDTEARATRESLVAAVAHVRATALAGTAERGAARGRFDARGGR